MRKHRNHVHSYGKEWPLCNEMYRYLGNDNVSRVPEIGWSVVQGAAAWSRRNTAPFDEHWAAILRQRGCVDVEKTWTVASCPSRFPSSHHRTTDATLQGTLTRITPLLAHTPPRPYSSHRPASTASTLSHFLSLSPTRCYAPRGSHPRGTCARILPPVRRNSSRRAVGIGKKTERGKRKKDTERGWLERVKIWGAAFSEKKKKREKEKRMPSFFLSASSAPSSSPSFSLLPLLPSRLFLFFPNSFFPNSSYHKSCHFFFFLALVTFLSTSLKNA